MGTRKMLVGAAVVVLLAMCGLALTQGGGRMGRGGRGGFGPGGSPGPGGGFDPAQTRQALTAAGATEADIQAIESHRTTQRSAMDPLMQAMQSLREAAGESGTSEQAAQAVSQYETLKATTLAQLAKAEAALRAQLDLSTKPKLHAALLTMGVLDNGMRGMGGMIGGRPGGPPGRGGRGGGPGGPGWAGPGAGRGASPSFDSRTLPNTDAEASILAVLQDMEGGLRMENVPAEDGRLLRVLAEAIGARHVVEIGTSNGYSALWLSLALRQAGGRLATYEIDPERAVLARENFRRAGVDDIVTVIEGDAHDTVTRITEPIDLLFIDADKEGYIDYLNKLLPLVRPGGLVVAHNMNPGQADPRYVEAITNNPALETIFLHMETAGIGVTLKKRS